MIRCVLAALLCCLTLLASPASAAAAGAPEDAVLDVEAVADRLEEDPLLVEPSSGIEVDEPAVRSALRDLPVPTYVVVLPQALVDADDNGIDGVLLQVVEALDDPRAVVVAVSDGGDLQAGEGGASGVEASRVLDEIVQARSDQAFDGQALTAALLEFTAAVERDADEGAERGLRGANRRTVGLAGLVGVAVLGGGLLLLRSQRKVRRNAPLADAETPAGSW